MDPVIVVHRGDYDPLRDYWRGLLRSATSERVEQHSLAMAATDIVVPAVLGFAIRSTCLPSTTRPIPIMMLTEPATGRVDCLRSPAPAAADGARPRARPFRKTGLGATGSVGSQFFRDPDTERWFYWNSSERLSAPRHRELDKTKRPP